MRLLRFDSCGDVRLTEHFDENIPPYAILSHTWGLDEEEVTFKDLESGSSKLTSKAGYAKIIFCGERARRDGLHHFWVDTCAIDKANYTELSEAITSMFRWYRDSVKCYVYLSDVSVSDCDKNGQTEETWISAFQNSRWFTRGWTLQELIAPGSVEFFSREGELLGDKKTLDKQIEEITGIPIRALREANLSEFSVIERLRWAENRRTRKREDKAYCLLGIFNIFMPLLYGEGENAFVRLTAEIERSSRGLLDQPRTTLTLARRDETTQKSLPESQSPSSAFEALILESKKFGAEENRERNDKVRSLIIHLAENSVKEVENHTSNLSMQMQEAARTHTGLIEQSLQYLQHIQQTIDVASPHLARSPGSWTRRKRKVPTKSLRVRGKTQGASPNQRKSKEQNISPVFQQNLGRPAAWQRGFEPWLMILFLASGTAYAGPSFQTTLHRLSACAREDPGLALTVLVAAMCILGFCYQLPLQVSLLSDSSVSFEDAFGSRLRIPFLQCSEFEIFRGYLEVHYKHRPGLQRVLHRQYLIVLQASESRVIDLDKWSQSVKPRSKLVMFMVMMSGKYTCPKCQGSLDATYSRVFCQRCGEHYLIIGDQTPAEGRSVEELEDEQEDEDEGTTENGFKIYEDDGEDDVMQTSDNEIVTRNPDNTSRNSRVIKADRSESNFKHMALSQSKKRGSVEDAEATFKASNYPEAMYPIRTHSTRLTVSPIPHFERYRVEKKDYSWAESSRTKLRTTQHELAVLRSTTTPTQLLKDFRRMSRDRRAEVYRLLEVKNAGEQQGTLWYLARMDTTKSRAERYESVPPKVEVFCMEILMERVVKNSALLFLRSMNGTFGEKRITLPFYPDVLRIGRQRNTATVPTIGNGYFDSKVLSRQHAETWANRDGKVFIRDLSSSNGTYINGQRLSPEHRESEPHELRQSDILEFGCDIVSDDQKFIVHHKAAAIVDFIGLPGRRNPPELSLGDL